jgi:hypothetical protein
VLVLLLRLDVELDRKLLRLAVLVALGLLLVALELRAAPRRPPPKHAAPLVRGGRAAGPSGAAGAHRLVLRTPLR